MRSFFMSDAIVPAAVTDRMPLRMAAMLSVKPCRICIDGTVANTATRVCDEPSAGR